MNLGQAVAVCLYELIRTQSAPSHEMEPEAASHAKSQELERMIQSLLDALAASGYIKPGTEPATEEKARRLIRRLNLTSSDAETLTGMFAKMRMRSRK